MTVRTASGSRRRRLGDAVALLPARLAGGAFGSATQVLRRVRSPRPIHRVGIVLDGWIESARAGETEPSGIDWIDGVSAGRVDARLSRGIGVPVPIPDIWGLAFRQVPDDDDLGAPTSGDILLATVAGSGRAGRFVPFVRLSPWGAPLGTVMPYRSSRGPILVSARTVSGAPASATAVGQARELGRRPWILQLLWATPLGGWHVFATLSLSAPGGEVVDRQDLRFDPLAHPPAGARTYAWTRVMREPAYRAARRV